MRKSCIVSTAPPAALPRVANKKSIAITNREKASLVIIGGCGQCSRATSLSDRKRLTVWCRFQFDVGVRQSRESQERGRDERCDGFQAMRFAEDPRRQMK